uniref:ATP synthase F0 subunit 8 n=1 Tax=Phlogothamnus polymaculatus TaxID=2897054 RepID=UPI001EDD5529|nr:ATP synthase F0 subunit 8 [Phlogothamnus polymaculatus]UKE80381.1 ATP synthase F0 subunit 8 [Phlogothamnus polymaculatus]
MPQMAPMWWTMLMASTIFMMIITMMIVYFYSNKIINTNINIKPKEMIWMW